MDGLLWLIAFGVFFLVMMRYGCGAHIAHGGRGRAGQTGPGAAQGGGTDPVCGMSVAADKGYSTAWRGTTYRFCSKSCLEKFETGPDRFAIVPAGKK